MKKFEYKQVSTDFADLNSLGGEGWEVCAINGQYPSAFYILKREKVEVPVKQSNASNNNVIGQMSDGFGEGFCDFSFHRQLPNTDGTKNEHYERVKQEYKGVTFRQGDWISCERYWETDANGLPNVYRICHLLDKGVTVLFQDREHLAMIYLYKDIKMVNGKHGDLLDYNFIK